jgi:hypothetical protein
MDRLETVTALFEHVVLADVSFLLNGRGRDSAVLAAASAHT